MTGRGMHGLLVLAIAALLAGCSGSSSATSAESSASVHTQETQTAPSKPTEPVKPSEAPSENRTEPAEAANSKSCAGQTRAGSHTSCPFAERVQAAFLADEKADGFPPAEVAAYSPVTNQEYHLQCVLIAQRTSAECTTGTALVYFPLPGKELPKPESHEEPPKSNEGGKEEEGEDEVGSSSHAGDTKFCEEHTCIGSFTTEPGTVVECSDGTFSHSGGIQGACSDHGGVKEE